MDQNPYRSPLRMSRSQRRSVGWWLFAAAAGAVIGFVFAWIALRV
jgi:hypothetical protein